MITAIPKICIKFDLEKDAWNWWNGCNKISYGVDWKLRIDEDLRSKIFDKDWPEAYKFLLPYLNKYYESKNVDEYIQITQAGFNETKDKFFSRMEQVTGHPIYRGDFTLFITSFPRFPYDYDNGYVWISDKKELPNQIAIFIHELLHFQYFRYFGEKVWNAIGEEAHSEIKEAMTIILNDEFADITPVRDNGYEIHKRLREDLIAIWRDARNMDVFIEKAIGLYKQKYQ